MAELSQELPYSLVSPKHQIEQVQLLHFGLTTSVDGVDALR